MQNIPTPRMMKRMARPPIAPPNMALRFELECLGAGGLVDADFVDAGLVAAAPEVGNDVGAVVRGTLFAKMVFRRESLKPPVGCLRSAPPAGLIFVRIWLSRSWRDTNKYSEYDKSYFLNSKEL